MIIKTRHTGLVVKDITASISFYEGLGLSVLERENERGDFLSQVVGLEHAEIETAKHALEHATSDQERLNAQMVIDVVEAL